MDAQNKSAENGAEQVSPAASDKSSARWRQIMLVLCCVGAGLVIVILALQVAEYLFYKAPPGVWPQPGAGGTISAPAVSVPSTMPIAVPTTLTELTPTPASSNAPVVAKP